MVTVDGRSQEAKGMTIDELATFLITELHVVSAMNFDGGGSRFLMRWHSSDIIKARSKGPGLVPKTYGNLAVD
jgi:exopolysaccharide biosynthesis protein